MMRVQSLEEGIIIKLWLSVAFFLLLLGASGQVYAHSIVTSESKKSGAVIHISPDDDPIAGEVSSIFIDITGGIISEDTHYFSLSVTDTSGFAYPISTELAGSTVSGLYNFPVRGSYTIQLTAVDRESGEESVFEEVQEVTRSADQARKINVPIWVFAALGLCALGCGFAGYLYVRQQK